MLVLPYRKLLREAGIEVQMTEAEKKALAHIRTLTDPERLLQMARNARGWSLPVERAALRQLAEVSPRHAPGTVEHACWQMVHTIEALRRLNGRKAWRMNRMRRKIDKDGEIRALGYCALKKTDGFDEVMDYGMPELTAEAIVLRHATHFGSETLEAARARLAGRGVSVNQQQDVM